MIKDLKYNKTVGSLKVIEKVNNKDYEKSDHYKIWSDLVPGRDDFAEEIINCLDSEFQRKNLEYYEEGSIENFYNDEGKSTVLAIDAEYGVGKTRFAKALNLHIENSIYLSVWKKDYIENPLLVLSEQIIADTYLTSEKDKVKDSLKSFWQKTKSLCYASIKSSSFSAGLDVFGANVKGNINIDKFFNELDKQKEKNSKENIKTKYKYEDELDDFKSILSDIIKEKGHTVIIIDELDRCRPDYAVKVLETIKHFFDIPGLSFVLPINKNFLEKSIEGFYNLDSSAFKDKNGYRIEHYIDRFFTRHKEISKVDYYRVIRDRYLKKGYKINEKNEVENINLNEKYKLLFSSSIKSKKIEKNSDNTNSISRIINISEYDILHIELNKTVMKSSISSSYELGLMSIREFNKILDLLDDEIINAKEKVYPSLFIISIIESRFINAYNKLNTYDISKNKETLLKIKNKYILDFIIEFNSLLGKVIFDDWKQRPNKYSHSTGNDKNRNILLFYIYNSKGLKDGQSPFSFYQLYNDQVDNDKAEININRFISLNKVEDLIKIQEILNDYIVYIDDQEEVFISKLELQFLQTKLLNFINSLDKLFIQDSEYNALNVKYRKKYR